MIETRIAILIFDEPPLIRNTTLMLHIGVWENFEEEEQILGLDNEAEVPVSNILV